MVEPTVFSDENSQSKDTSSPEEQPTGLTAHDEATRPAQIIQPNHRPRFAEMMDSNQESASNHPAIVDIDSQGFLCTDNLRCLPSEDINFLWIKGSLSIPDFVLTRDFVHQYFKKMHPMLPVLNEAQFWSALGGNPVEKISIFVFQALMFAISPFMSLDTLHKCGFADKRDARKQLYNRAKLLFDLKVEMKPSAKAQGALLLTHHTSAIAPLAGSLWLTSSIENAMLIDAQPSLVDDQVSEAMKKRLWWSLLLRDRSLCIGLRRRPQITSINIHRCRDWLQEEDFEDEMHTSKVYDYQNKIIFLSALQEQCTLAVLLTDLVTLIFNPRLAPATSYTKDEFESQMITLKNIKESLTQWHSQATYRPDPKSNRCSHPCTALKNMTFMYYHTASVDLAQYAALLIEEYPALPAHRYHETMAGIGRDLKAGIDGLTQIMEYFSLTGHVENLPLSVLAYVGMPLVLAAIDLKLSPSRSETASRQRRLDYLSNIIRHSEDLYDVTDYVAAGTNHILQLAYVTTQNFFLPKETPSTKRHPSERLNSVGINKSAEHNQVRMSYIPRGPIRANNWLEAFIQCPRAYLLISTSVDYSLSVGRLPYDNCLPALVREIPNQFSMSRLPWLLNDRSHTFPPLWRVDEKPDSEDSRSTTRGSVLENTLPKAQQGLRNSYEDLTHGTDDLATEFDTRYQGPYSDRINERPGDVSLDLINLDFFDLGSDPRPPHSMVHQSSNWPNLDHADTSSSLFNASELPSYPLGGHNGYVMEMESGANEFDSILYQSVYHGLLENGSQTLHTGVES
ncbi:hypothetical protein N7466_003637 [Penicillium verhagenii]|uniref:uncharacterized protein n=1 Tax=Penicillium verhagenii TaxID=1562060 RepID=UPI0025455E93|nr:uncharacterized protein N7466_003637 [Penicillium verhagenii]KAJ5934090.1 hypothetical protein N7466_003637 [Penicillium verhagenii]